MIKLFDRNSTKLTISEFYDNYKSNKYNFNAVYQRQSGIWAEDKKSFLIDSIMKNYPMPPIFLQPKVDTNTGKTTYDVIDGKQRLETIIQFIENKIYLPTYFSEDKIFINGATDIEEEMNGQLFDEIKIDQKKSDFVKQFWTYSINIDYLYESDTELISNIFDRLNRNGEPLTRQELRNARYYSSYMLKSIKELAQTEYWKSRFTKLKIERMEDEEFISELFFIVSENTLLDSSPKLLDDLYERYLQVEADKIDSIVTKFDSITQFIQKLDIDYDELKKLDWTTHLYGLFSFAWYCTEKKIDAFTVKDQLITLYRKYFNESSGKYSKELQKYKDSCSSNTRSHRQRANRLSAILEFCDIEK